jgi:hypothetical protein
MRQFFDVVITNNQSRRWLMISAMKQEDIPQWVSSTYPGWEVKEIHPHKDDGTRQTFEVIE